ncbi:hypothetical protein BGZ57DRAFT_946387 [Hyaloscypha finlandica]|nr:hypothetical protein BGZ57DRAFT_946387 [Hyaloscypha finlandica]
MSDPKTIVVGAGVAGIAMGHTLKWKLGYSNFEIYEKREGLGGTWRANTYPGCGSDVPIHLYSFSFNLNPDWSQELAEQEEILQYIENTADKFDLRQHIRFRCECLSAKWSLERQEWEVSFLDLGTKQRFKKHCAILLTAVGGFSQPRDVCFPGLDGYGGKVFHTAEWDHTFDYRDRRIAVIGNGCSAAQVVPSIAPSVRKLTQYARSPQWYHERPNHHFTRFEKLCFRYIPFWQRYHRLKVFLATDQLSSVYGPEPKQIKQRIAVENKAKNYIYRETPQEYHDFIVPEFPLGCKRRIFDPGYLASLHRYNVDLLPEGIREITKTGIVSQTGKSEDFDAIILATGFKVQEFLTPMEIVGKTGESVSTRWGKKNGAQAYMGTFVHNYPNFGILFGPNTFPAFNSVIFSVEVQVEYVAKTLISPILDRYADVVEVKAEAEEKFIKDLDGILEHTVFSAGCSNWYINSAGRNSASWPGLASTFWKAAFFPRWRDFEMSGGSRTWLLHKVLRSLSTTPIWLWLTLLSLAAAVLG